MCLIYQCVTIRQNLQLNFETAFSVTFGLDIRLIMLNV